MTRNLLVSLAAPLLLLCAVARGDEFNVCNTTTPTNESVSLKYLEAAGNVTVTLNDEPHLVSVSLCEMAPFQCGVSGYLFFAGDSCESGINFDLPSSSVTYNETAAAASLELSASALPGTTALVSIKCDSSAESLRPIEHALLINSSYYFAFASRTVCPGYAGPPSSSDMLSRGAIVGIIIGFVAVVVIVSAVFQWKQKTSSDEYQSI